MRARSRSIPTGIGETIYAASDSGQVTLAEAKLLLQTVLSAGADTTFITMANALRAWAVFPEEYAKLRAEPKKVRAAFDESLRWDSPSRMAGRIATRGRRDRRSRHPRRHPLRADVRRRQPRSALLAGSRRLPASIATPRHSLGWGYGVHGCVGRTLATMEAQGAARRDRRAGRASQLAGPYEPWMTTVGHGPIRQPVRLIFA